MYIHVVEPFNAFSFQTPIFVPHNQDTSLKSGYFCPWIGVWIKEVHCIVMLCLCSSPNLWDDEGPKVLAVALALVRTWTLNPEPTQSRAHSRYVCCASSLVGETITARNPTFAGSLGRRKGGRRVCTCITTKIDGVFREVHVIFIGTIIPWDEQGEEQWRQLSSRIQLEHTPVPHDPEQQKTQLKYTWMINKLPYTYCI